jgi:hypothetical protein
MLLLACTSLPPGLVDRLRETRKPAGKKKKKKEETIGLSAG